ncbi:MAG TPA: hypothetical protein VEY12_03215 [Thermoplasmata archaeon]|nr:hypothetical protein [Thermoplasmata archaeon]
MLPVTQSSLVSQMHVTTPTRGVTAELARYVQSEYGANAAYARTMVERARKVESIRIRTGPAGLVRRFLATVSETLATARASPGGA